MYEVGILYPVAEAAVRPVGRYCCSAKLTGFHSMVEYLKFTLQISNIAVKTFSSGADSKNTFLHTNLSQVIIIEWCRVPSS